MKWIKIYTEMARDPKLLLLAFEDRWHYVAVLLAKADGLLDQPDHLRDRLMCAHLGLSDVAAGEVKSRLADVCLIDTDWEPLGWSNRQSEDATGAARKRRQRAREKLEEEQSLKERNKKPEVRSKNKEDGVTVTGQSRDISTQENVDQNALIYSEFSKQMWQRIQPITNQRKEPNFTTWANDIRKLVEIDGYDLRVCGEVFVWANQDDFWSTNVLSPAKLRKNFPRLMAQYKKNLPTDYSAMGREAQDLMEQWN